MTNRAARTMAEFLDRLREENERQKAGADPQEDIRYSRTVPETAAVSDEVTTTEYEGGSPALDWSTDGPTWGVGEWA